jgi:hypothetical protein
MESAQQARIHTGIQDNPPVPDARLKGWTVIVEWEIPGGEKILTRMSSADTPVWEARGYMHEAIGGVWVAAGKGEWDGNGE